MSRLIQSLDALDSTNSLQQTIKLSLLRLQIAVATNVLLSDEDVGDASLSGDLFEGILEGCTVVYTKH
jgi:hypothetical protein